MIVKQAAVVAALLASIPIADVSAAANAAHRPAKGQISVKVVSKSSGKPIASERICPLNGKTNKFVGKCGVTNSHGVALLKRVKPGRWTVSYEADIGRFDYPKKVRVHAGHVKKITWHQPPLG
jgi:hypothetical protein